ncbi:GSCOCG00003568001-RA-CDS, partial [Cotesia congregata]
MSSRERIFPSLTKRPSLVTGIHSFWSSLPRPRPRPRPRPPRPRPPRPPRSPPKPPRKPPLAAGAVSAILKKLSY